METLPYLGETLRRWRVGPSTFLARPEAGARLMAWHLTLGDGSERDVLYWPELNNLADFHRVRGGNPVLFPFAGRCYESGEIGWWRAPDGTRRPMPMHGLARQGRFRISHAHAAGFTATLEPDETARAAYPFDYEFNVTYRFGPLDLVCEFTLVNLDRVPLPWSAGHHFYFAVPWAAGTRREDYRLTLPAGRRFKHGPAGELQATTVADVAPSLADPALTDTVHCDLATAAFRCSPGDPSGGVTVQHGAGETPPPEAALVTWSESPDAPYYCLEPWMGPPNAPGTGVGLHWVTPGQTGRFTVKVTVD
jgi:galactose mutarotase-like enzyme